MIKQNDDGMFVGYIKELLGEFNLPMIKVGDSNVFANQHYIKDGAIYLKEQGSSKRVKTYRYGERIQGITKNLTLRNNIYDAETHRYLGDYLRFQRDYLGIDLMSLYNCCGYDSPLRYSRQVSRTLSDGGTETIDEFNSEDANHFIYSIPVRFGKKYTIAIDCATTVSCICDYYANNDIVDVPNVTDQSINSTYRSYSSLRFSRPFMQGAEDGESKVVPILYETPAANDDNHGYESVLRLMLKLPSTCESSVVVLEGDYTSGCKLRTDDDMKQHFYDSSDYDYVSRPSLLMINTGEKTLLADRLVEYLTMNAIAPNSDPEDIKRIQRRLVKSEDDSGSAIKQYRESISYYGMWREDLRRAIYEYIRDNDLNVRYADVLSYVDKDVEKEMGGIE